jgi:hypothetical protein
LERERHIMEAKHLFYDNKYDLAIEEYKLLLADNPNDYNAIYNIGLIQKK